MEYVKLKFESARDHDRAAIINGGILLQKKVKYDFDPEMYVRLQDANEMQCQLRAQGIHFEAEPQDEPKIAITAQRDRKTRAAVWLKYHYTLWSRTFTLRIHVPGFLWAWADRYVEAWHQRNT